MAIPNPNPNIEDGKKCDNKTYSSNKIEALVAAATELPTPEAGDAGKVLTVNDELGYDLETAPGDRLPETALADAGKVVTVNDAGDAYELDTPVAPTSIIDDSAAAANKVYSSNKVNTLLGGKVNTSDMTVKTADYTQDTAIAAGAVDSHDITVNNDVYGIIAGFLVTESTDIVPIRFYFNAAHTISFRVKNVGSAASTYKVYVYYI